MENYLLKSWQFSSLVMSMLTPVKEGLDFAWYLPNPRVKHSLEANERIECVLFEA
jgi:hypothetical protein